MLTSVPDLLSFSRFNRRTIDIKDRMQVTSQEVVTGQREDLTKASNGDIGSVQLLKKALDDIEVRQGLYKLTNTRINLMSETLEGSRSALDNMGGRAMAVLASHSETGVNTLINEAENTLKTIFSSLQINVGSRNLFSGNEASQQPLGDVSQMLSDIRAIVSAGPDMATIDAALDTYFYDPTGGFQTTIYQGGSGNAQTVLLRNDQRVDFTVRADDEAIKQVFRGLGLLASADVSPFARFSGEFNELFGSATFDLNNGEAGLVELEAKMGIGMQLIRESMDIQEAERITLTASYREVAFRDQFEATNELKILETQLETSYVITARLSELTLSNYLR